MYCGILILDKPAGLTSHDVVSRVRRKLHTKKVGHAGTLDPDATGVLVLCIGDATRLIEYIVADEKVYVGEAVFGIGTDTDDASGEVTATRDAGLLQKSDVLRAAGSLTGVIMQTPPKFSAIHVNGRRAYDLAREGHDFELPPREIQVHEFSTLEFQPGPVARAAFRVHCSKGTYIRSLCRDWGKVLQTPAHMACLRRVQSGAYRIDEAVSLDEFEASDAPECFLRPMLEALREIPKVCVSAGDAQRLAQGQTMILGEAMPSGPVAVIGDDAQLVAVGEIIARGGEQEVVLRPKKVFWKGGRQ
ncbi:tRNA pseudouridine(55) synthase TruB [Alicyclobacillus mengziensis]|uniref:tRNA pseudouridine synthase B n=1 Tax=Alicyclobacillus mengziensis TaxID=2931921 RepID=A0A9X7VX66_9BACL|nr:tRNA pseudouridine(55) synthase TruB [Alicyclobacillus mengziensis]QSO45383.1 tRNA pseudouridine(55) synthase TruB [Alicyclobacillus mengziensis]